MKKTLAAWPVAAQLLGGGAVIAGVFLLAGLAVALVLTGVSLLAVGTAREAGWI